MELALASAFERLVEELETYKLGPVVDAVMQEASLDRQVSGLLAIVNKLIVEARRDGPDSLQVKRNAARVSPARACARFSPPSPSNHWPSPPDPTTSPP